LRLILLFDPGGAILPPQPQTSLAVVSSGGQGRSFLYRFHNGLNRDFCVDCVAEFG